GLNTGSSFGPPSTKAAIFLLPASRPPELQVTRENVHDRIPCTLRRLLEVRILRSLQIGPVLGTKDIGTRSFGTDGGVASSARQAMRRRLKPVLEADPRWQPCVLPVCWRERYQVQ